MAVSFQGDQAELRQFLSGATPSNPRIVCMARRRGATTVLRSLLDEDSMFLQGGSVPLPTNDLPTWPSTVALDNAEEWSNDELRLFLQRAADKGTRVLATCRSAVGAFDTIVEHNGSAQLRLYPVA